MIQKQVVYPSDKFRTQIYFSALVMILAGAACKKEDAPPPTSTTATWVTPGNAGCLPESASEHAGTILRGSLGSSATVLNWGDSTDETLYQSIAMGAPGGTLGGSVKIAGISAGLFSGAVFSYTRTDLSAAMRTVSASVLTGNAFGQSMQGFNVKRCTGGSINQGCGDELLVGAPGSGDDSGVIHWLYADAGTADNPKWTYGGSFAPSSLSNHASFGWAMTEAQTSGLGSLLVVSAPGDNQIYLLSADKTASTFSVVQTLTGAAGGNLGYAISTGDFDNDGNEDLVASSPNTHSVHFFKGSSSTTAPFNAVSFMDNTSSSKSSDLFGASLASGPMFGSDIKRYGVLVGVPGHDTSTKTDVGRIVAYLLNSDGSSASGLKISSRTVLNPPGGGTSGDHFGSAVAIGNFAPLDLTSSTVSNYAKLQEIAVGSPGFNGGEGAVFVLSTNDKGFASSTPHVTLRQYSGASAGALFGSTLHSVYLENPVTDHITQDLITGAPGWSSSRGSVTITRGDGTYSTSTTDGKWTGRDSFGNSEELTTTLESSTNTLWVAFKSDFQMEVLCDGSAAGTHTVDSNRSGESYGLVWDPSLSAWVIHASYFDVKASITGSTLTMEWYNFNSGTHCASSKVSATGNPFGFTKAGSCD
jgi:hypothetical protein